MAIPSDIFNVSMYPFSDFEKVNLDWLLDVYKELQRKLEDGELDGPQGPQGPPGVPGPGLTDDVKTALLQIADHVAYTDGNGPTYYADLYNALYSTPIVTLLSITATFNQGANTIYDTDSLSTLIPYLTVSANWSDGTSTVVPSTDYVLSGSLVSPSSTITVSYNGESDTFTVNVTTNPVYLVSITAAFNQGANVIYDTDSLSALVPYLTVTATYSDSSTATISSIDYLLSGTLAAGTSTITVTYGGYSDTFNVTVTANALDFITASFNQGANVIYDTDSLSDLVPYLTVTATYLDSSTATISSDDYALSGTLTAGTSTITVTYGGDTETFNVTVTAQYLYYDYIYAISNVSPGGSDYDYVNTGLTYSPSFNTLNVEFEAMNSNSGNSSEPLFGANIMNTSDTGNILWYARANKGGFSAFNLGQAKQLNTVPGDTRAVCKYFFVDGGESYMQWDSTTVAVATMTKASVATNNKDLILAGGYSTSTGEEYGFVYANRAKLGYIKFTDPSTNTLLYHFIPAYNNKTQKYGYYEAINGVFYPTRGNRLQCANWGS